MTGPSRWLVVASTVAIGVALCWPNEDVARSRPAAAWVARTACLVAVAVAAAALVVWP